MKINSNSSFKIDFDTTAEKVKTFFARIPDDAKVSVSVSRGDRPGESDTKSIEVSWTEEI